MSQDEYDMTMAFSEGEISWSENSGDRNSSVVTYDHTEELHITRQLDGYLKTLLDPAPSEAESSSIHWRKVRHRDQVQPGEQVDYELTEVIGKGGMGRVYHAIQKATGREVAIKVLERKEDHIRYDFTREAVINANLEHPGIIRVYELALSDELGLFYAMELNKGRPWSEVIKEQSHEERLQTFIRLMDAVAYAHSRGVIHRDLKPANVMIGEFGHTLLVDWGLALSRDEIAACQEIPQLYGSLAYMAPEMITANTRKLGTHCDIYMLGALLYQIMTDKAPHHPRRPHKEWVLSIRENQVAPPENFPLLGQIAMRALSTKPGDRFASVHDFQEAIQEYLTHRTAHELVQNGRDSLEKGNREQSIDHLSRAVHTLEQAVEMLPASKTTRGHLDQARVDLVRCALDIGDAIYAHRVTRDPAFPDADLAREAEEALRIRQLRMRRSRMFGFATAASVVLTVAFLGSGFLWLNNDQESMLKAYEESESGRKEALAALEASETARKATEQDRNLAEQALALLQESDGAGNRSAAEKLAYRVQLRASERQLQSVGHYPAFARGLSRIPVAQRGPEWGLLHAQGHPWLRRVETPSAVTAAGFSADGATLYVGYADGSLERYNSLRGAAQLRLEGHRSPIKFITVDAESRQVYSLDASGRLLVRDAHSGEPVDMGEDFIGSPMRELYASRSGVVHALSSQGTWWQVRDGVARRVRSDLPANGLHTAFSPEGSAVAISLESGKVEIFQAIGGRGQSTDAFDHVVDLAWSEDGTELTVLMSDGRAAYVRGDTGELRTTIDLPFDHLRQWIRLPGSHQAVVLREKGELSLWDEQARTLREVAHGLMAQDAVNLVVPAAGNGLVLTSGSQGNFRISHWLGLSPAWREWLPDGEIVACAVSPSVGEMAIGDASGRVHLRSFRNGSRLTLPGQHEGAVTCLAYAPEEDTLISGGTDHQLRLWRRGEPVSALRGHVSPVTCVVLDPAGSRVISGEQNGRVFVRDLDSGKVTAAQRAHQAPVTQVAARPGGRWASADASGLICVELPRYNAFREVVDVDQRVNRIAWLDDRMLLIGLEDGSMRMVDADTSKTTTRALVGDGPIRLLEVVSPSRVLVASSGTPPQLFSLPDLKPVWSLPVKADAWAQASLSQQGLGVCTADGQVRFLPLLEVLDHPEQHLADLMAARAMEPSLAAESLVRNSPASSE